MCSCVCLSLQLPILDWAFFRRECGNFRFSLLPTAVYARVANTHHGILEDIFGLLGGFIFFGISIAAYYVAGSRRCLDVADDTEDDVLEIYVVLLRLIFLLVVTFVVIFFAVPFHSFFGVCSAGHPI